MEIILKIKFNSGRTLWKLDSFWSLGNMQDAKIHSVEIDDLLKNLLYIVNDSINKDSEDCMNYIDRWNKAEIGYDYVNQIVNHKFEFIKDGLYIKKLNYNEDSEEFELIDISRRSKLKALKMKTYYEVRFKYYKYNTGNADNGTYQYAKKFDNIKKARAFRDRINLCYNAIDDYDSLSYKIGEKIVEDISTTGFINSYGTIYEITEKIID